MTRMIAGIFLFGAMLSFLGIVALMVQLWLETLRLPYRPMSVRVNPFNVLAHKELWSSEVERLNRRIVISGLLFLACSACAVTVLIIGS